ncbi:MAG: acyltransferase [Rhizobacter sp.]|nr:acyltransferase [Rhizobacter sp.]
MSYFNDDELKSLGFKRLGRSVRISRLASLYGRERMEIGDHARIDDFCVLSAGREGISIGRYVHVAVHCSLMGVGRIELHDYSGLSSRVSIYSSNDDYSGRHMTNPAVPEEFTNVTHAPVILQRHVIIGAGSVVLPGVTLHEGAGVGALSLVTRDCERLGFYFGSPAVLKRRRSSEMFELERRLLDFEGDSERS